MDHGEFRCHRAGGGGGVCKAADRDHPLSDIKRPTRARRTATHRKPPLPQRPASFTSTHAHRGRPHPHASRVHRTPFPQRCRGHRRTRRPSHPIRRSRPSYHSGAKGAWGQRGAGGHRGNAIGGRGVSVPNSPPFAHQLSRRLNGTPRVTFRRVVVSLRGPGQCSLRMLRRVAASCRPLRPLLLLVSFRRSRSPVERSRSPLHAGGITTAPSNPAPPPPPRSLTIQKGDISGHVWRTTRQHATARLDASTGLKCSFTGWAGGGVAKQPKGHCENKHIALLAGAYGIATMLVFVSRLRHQKVTIVLNRRNKPLFCQQQPTSSLQACLTTANNQ